MTPSIRTFLLINLLLSVTLITSLAIIGNLVLSHKDIQKQLDTQLIHTAVSMRSLLSLDLNQIDINSIQKSLNNDRILNRQTPLNVNVPLPRKPNEDTFFIEFQVWDANHRLLIRSPGAPVSPFTNGEPGLSSVTINNQAWRTYTGSSIDNPYTIMIAEHTDYRQALENRLTQDSIFIMLLSYPFLGILIWFIVGKALFILKRVTREVSQREPSYLEPFDVITVPAEIVPLIQALNNLFSRLKDAFEREKRFTGDAAHELKTPLAAISAQAQVALRADNEASQREAILKILTGVNRSAHVVQQLLTMSRMLPEATLQNHAPVKLAREVADIAAMLAPDAINKNIELEFLSPDAEAIINGNATSIGILIRNLIDNSIRYTPNDGWVNIEIQEADQNVTLIITDSGPGIPKSLRKRVFERFYRVVGSSSSGSGLGLSIVQQIAKLHGAEISLMTPAAGKGLEVRVVFPK